MKKIVAVAGLVIMYVQNIVYQWLRIKKAFVIQRLILTYV